MSLKKRIKNIPLIGPVIARVSLWIKRKPFRNSTDFWERRYAEGGTSGPGSYDRLAEFKAQVINEFVTEHDIQTVVELGCGDGNQLLLANYPQYVGMDISPSAIDRCSSLFRNDNTKRFMLLDPHRPIRQQTEQQFDLALSLDVIYHLVEQDIFERHLTDLFDLSEKYVIIYSSNKDSKHLYHEKHRKFTAWVEAHISGWKMIRSLKNKYPYDPESAANTSKADFFFYAKVT